jgi:peroxiredoxin Q/BCP
MRRFGREFHIAFPDGCAGSRNFHREPACALNAIRVQIIRGGETPAASGDHSNSQSCGFGGGDLGNPSIFCSQSPVPRLHNTHVGVLDAWPCQQVQGSFSDAPQRSPPVKIPSVMEAGGFSVRVHYDAMLSWFAKPLPVGSPAPPFISLDEEGSAFVLNQQRNKYVILVFYPGDDTPVCTRQLCEFRDQWSRIRERGGFVVGVNPRGESSHAGFKKKHNLPFPLLVDNGNRIARLYHCNGPIVRRTVYVIGKDGTILYGKRGKPSVDEILTALPQSAAAT